MLTERQAAAYIGRSYRSLYRSRHGARGPVHVRLGSLVRYRVEDLNQWLRRVGPSKS